MKPITEQPGAGVPFLQRLIGALAVRFSAWQSFEKRQKAFLAQTAAIIALCDSIPVAQRDTPVLIAPQLGLEDSSRNWSINMTLEHVMIVTKGITQIIQTLRANQTLPFVVGTADVKPTGDLQGDLRQRFQAVMTQCADSIHNDPQPFKPQPHHAHPWFGPLTAAQWHGLLSIHHGIHTSQLSKIIKSLKN